MLSPVEEMWLADSSTTTTRSRSSSSDDTEITMQNVSLLPLKSLVDHRQMSDFIPIDVLDLYTNPIKPHELKFKCRRGIERYFIYLSNDYLRVVPRASGCKTPVEGDLPLEDEALINKELEDGGGVSASYAPTEDATRSDYSLTQFTHLQRSVLRSKSKLKQSRDKKSHLRWESLTRFVTIRRSYFESYLVLESMGSPSFKLLINSSIIDVLENCIKAFYCNATANLITHVHHERGSGSPGSITVQSPRWHSPPAKTNTILSPPSKGSVKSLFATCMKTSDVSSLRESSSFPEEVMELTANSDILNGLPAPPEPAGIECFRCNLPRGQLPSPDFAVVAPKCQVPTVLEPDPQEAIGDAKTTWIFPLKQNTTLLLPIDVMAKLFVMNEPLPSRKAELLSNPDVHVGGLDTLLYAADDPSTKRPWGDIPSKSRADTFPFIGPCTEALTGGPIISPKVHNWEALRLAPIRMMTSHSLPDNYIVRKILSVLPAIPVESDGLESLKLIHCSPSLIVLDWTEHIVEHRCKEGKAIHTGLPSYILNGGSQFIYRIVFRHAPQTSTDRCYCATAISTSLGYRTNSREFFERDCEMSVPKGFEYNGAADGTAMKMATNIIGKIEAAETLKHLIQIIKDEIEYLRLADSDERTSFLKPIQSSRKFQAGNPFSFSPPERVDANRLMVSDRHYMNKHIPSPKVLRTMSDLCEFHQDVAEDDLKVSSRVRPIPWMFPSIVVLFMVSIWLVYFYGQHQREYLLKMMRGPGAGIDV